MQFILKCIVSWSTLAALGRHQIMQYTIMVPLFGYMILFNDWLSENFKVYGEFPKWQVYVTYYGLTFLALGSLIYVFRCPAVIKEFRSASEYIGSEKDVFSGPNLIAAIDEMYNNYNFSNRNIYVHKSVEACLFSMNKSDDVVNLIDDIIKNKKSEDRMSGYNRQTPTDMQLMESYYKIMNETREISRNSTLLLYIVGFTLLSMPALIMFSRVTMKSIELIRLSIGL